MIETLSNFFKSKFFKEILEYLEFFKILIKISNEKNLDEKKKIILKNSQNYKIQTVQQTTYNKFIWRRKINKFSFFIFISNQNFYWFLFDRFHRYIK